MRIGGAIVLGLFLEITSPIFAQTEKALGPSAVQFGYGGNFGWGQYQNISGVPVHLIYIFPPNDRRGMDLAKDQVMSTGLSKRELEEKGKPAIFVCPGGTHPVDMDGKSVRFSVKEYQCKR